MATSKPPYMSVTWSIRRARDGNGYEGIVRIPGQIIQVPVKARGKTKADALSRAAQLANRIAENPIVSAVLPPGASAALKVTQKLADAAKVGKLASAAANVVGPGAKRLAKALGGIF